MALVERRSSRVGATADGIASVLTQRFFDRLVQREAACVLYTHLGKVNDPRCPLGPSTQAAFRRLAVMRERRAILVTTTHRLLRYLTVRDSVRFTGSRVGQHIAIVIESVDDPVSGPYTPSSHDVMGLTFLMSRCDTVDVTLPDGVPLDCDILHDGPLTVASVRWRGLTFPDGDPSHRGGFPIRAPEARS